jgi:hypothetical protein
MPSPVIRKGRELDLLLARFTVRAYVALFGVFLIGAVGAWRHGVARDHVILLLGSLLSGVALLAYGLSTYGERGRRSWALALASFGAFIPYLFGCYLVFYRGLWALTRLRSGFSGSLLLRSAVFIVCGFVVVRSIYRLSELTRAVSEGRAQIV